MQYTYPFGIVNRAFIDEISLFIHMRNMLKDFAAIQNYELTWGTIP